MPDTLYGVIGWPLGQSLSPLMHNTGFQVLGIPSAYMAWPVPEGRLGDFMGAMRLLGIAGCSVTIPHKINVARYLDNVSEGASLAGAVNTIYLRGDELCGENTDVSGFLAPLSATRLDRQDVLLLGAGGAAHAVAAGLRLSGCSMVRVASPGNRRQYDLATRFGFTPISWEERYQFNATLIINATPLGMHGDNAQETPYDFARAPKTMRGIAYDLVYNPVETPFLRDASRAGLETISGLAMFMAQGNEQFRLWTGRDLPAQAFNAVTAALGARGGKA